MVRSLTTGVGAHQPPRQPTPRLAIKHGTMFAMGFGCVKTARNADAIEPDRLVAPHEPDARQTQWLSQSGVPIPVPDDINSDFDHGAFDPKTRRVFIAHAGGTASRSSKLPRRNAPRRP